MLAFQDIDISHKQQVQDYLCRKQYGSTEGSFADLFIWGEKYHTQVCFQEGFLFVRSSEDGKPRYLFPYGDGEIPRALELICQDARENGVEPCMVGVTDEMREKLDGACPGLLRYEETRDLFDYIYAADDLINLPGKKFHQKRNHVNKFMKLYRDRYAYEPICQENLDEVRAFQEKWLAANKTGENEAELAVENRVIQRAFQYFFEIGFIGGVLRVDGDVVAYTMGTRLCCESFLVSIEKADIAYPGCYQVINQLFAQHNCQGLKYINREDDTGSEGLRKAKLSYNPVILLRKYRVTWARD